MKGGTVQINWHGTKPVLTLDFHPVSGLLATGGADFDIKVHLFFFPSLFEYLSRNLISYLYVFQLWKIDSGEEQSKGPGATYQSSLTYHSSSVNALRFSPSGIWGSFYRRIN